MDVSLELDIVVSASLDGTINMHTVHKGHFVRTISFCDIADNIGDLVFSNLICRLGNQRHLLVYTSGHGKSANLKVRIFFVCLFVKSIYL